MSGSVVELKKKLEEPGLSTSTPGLVGEDRFKELSSRLQGYHSQQEHNSPIDGINAPGNKHLMK